MDRFALLAYLEPGTGTLILQLLVAMLAGTVYAFRLGWARIKSTVARMIGSTADVSGTADESRIESTDQTKRDAAA